MRGHVVKAMATLLREIAEMDEDDERLGRLHNMIWDLIVLLTNNTGKLPKRS